MSRRPTTSFFDQDHSAKPKFTHKTGNLESNSAKSNAIPPSSKTKKQLSNFLFPKPGNPKKSRSAPDLSPGVALGADTVNPVTEDGESIPALSSGGAEPHSTPLKNTPQTPHTPAPKIPLAQLVHFDDEKFAPGGTQVNTSPEDRIVWQSGTPRPALAGKKRGVQDSPVDLSSPAPKKRRDPISTTKTPMDDPASQLWKKYSGTGAKPRAGGDPTARLFQGANRSPSTFRRAYTSPGGLASGSRLKRRKTTPFDDSNNEEAFKEVTDDAESTGSRMGARKARVHLLMTEVKKKMDTPEMSDDVPMPSSMPEVDELALPSSPLRPTSARVAEAKVDKATTENTTLNSSDGEEFGDFDVDMDDLAEIDHIASTQQVKLDPVSAPNILPIEAKAAPLPLFKESGIKMHDDEDYGLDDDDDDYGDDDIFGGDEIDNLMASIEEPSSTKSVPYAEKQRRIQRFEVIEISKSDYQAKNGIIREQTILRVRDETAPNNLKVFLREAWHMAAKPAIKQTVHIIGTFDRNDTIVIDNAQNYLIIDPDYLISATVVADTVGCMRKAVMQERVKATGDISKAMVYGNILHAVFQAGLEDNDFSTENLEHHIDQILLANLQSLYQLREEIPELSVAKDYVMSKLPLLQAWAELYVGGKPKADATVTDYRGKQQPRVAINKLLDIEEHVWSPKFGLKGNVDATVQAITVDGASQKTLTVPLELKTGRNSAVVSHRAQTMMYTLLMSDRYDIDVGNGLLYYLEQKEMIRVPAIRNELRELIIKRNEVANYTIDRDVLPEMLEDERTCSRCYAKNQCTIYNKLAEGGDAEHSGFYEVYDKLTSHLTPKHAEFFKHWDSLLTKEEKGSVQFRREIWTLNSSAREALGRCFAGVVIVSRYVDKNSSKINKYHYTFRRQTEGDTTFFDSQLGEGDPIVISDEKGHYALAIGFITGIERYQLSVQVDRRLHNARTRQHGFEENVNQCFNGIFEIDGSQRVENENVVYRIDKDEYGGGMASVRNNLVQLFTASKSDKVRRLLVEKEAPTFKASPTAYQVPAEANLNCDQKNAVEKVMAAQDYALILGMPGTGKTTTIAWIIRALVSQGKSVLLTSYTHTAVDNILMKLVQDNFNILRLGSRSKIHPDIINRKIARLAEQAYTSYNELKDLFESPQIVATTCLGINHPIFNERKFDYCIVDEASQITLPTCIGPLRFANTFVLVGDHYQLPPLVRNMAAREGGLDESLFKILCDAHPDAVVDLEHQYRMCEEIMKLSNELIYKGRLKCGTEEVAKRSLELPNHDGLARLHENGNFCADQCWIRNLLAENVKACFVDTDLVPAVEEKKGDRINNPVEAELVHQLVESLLSTGIEPTKIGVISVYRSQLKTIQHLLRSRPTVEMYTADRFQGRDKEIIIISLVRSNADQNVGELLRDWRRINVAFTRARSKLIVLGSKKTLMSNELLSDFVKLMEREKWVYQLPEGAHEVHNIPLVMGTAPAVPESPRKKQGRDNEEEGGDREEGKKRKRGSPRRRIDGRTMGTKASGNTPPVLGKRAVLGQMMNEML